MAIEPINVTTHKLWVESSKLCINTTQTYEVTDEIRKQSSKILNDWLKMARISLRIAGGDSNYPFVKPEAITKKEPSRRSYIPFHNFGVLIDHYAQTKNVKTSHECLVEFILAKKYDINALSHTLRDSSWGDQKWVNICNRFKKQYRPVLMLHLLNGGTL